MAESSNLTNQFLIAMPSLADPNFFHSVTYICQHNEQGAMGIVINQPLEVQLGEVFSQMELDIDDQEIALQTVFLGGPVEQERGFILHNAPHDWEATLHVTDNVSVTSSRDILKAMNEGSGPQQTFVALGYAGWSGGQLEQELADNAWLTGPADTQIIFEMPAEARWQAAAKLAGIDLSKLSDEVGHA
jgi:putative transcriptional regulator